MPYSPEQLRRLIAQIPNLNENPRLDPRVLIRVTNALLPLGKDAALTTLSNYVKGVKSIDNCSGLFLLLRCLFDVPQHPGFMPPMRVGAPALPEPLDHKLLPRFPLVLVDDIPLMLVYGYTLGGDAEPVTSHIDYFRRYGTLRRTVLNPTNKPLSVLAKLEASPQCLWTRSYRAADWGGRARLIQPQDLFIGDARSLVMTQLLRTISSFYPVHGERFGEMFTMNQANTIWQKAIREASRIPIRWDQDKGDYVRV